MKISALAIVFSLIWHGVFIFLIRPDIFQIESNLIIPKIKFWGEVFQIVQPHSNIEEVNREEVAFLEQLFESEFYPTMDFKEPYSFSHQFLLSIDKDPDLKNIELRRKNIREYIVPSSIDSQGLSYSVEIDNSSQPVMVLAETMSGDFIQDSKDWVKIKAAFFYSPEKKEIIFSEEDNDS